MAAISNGRYVDKTVMNIVSWTFLLYVLGTFHIPLNSLRFNEYFTTTERLFPRLHIYVFNRFLKNLILTFNNLFPKFKNVVLLPWPGLHPGAKHAIDN